MQIQFIYTHVCNCYNLLSFTGCIMAKMMRIVSLFQGVFKDADCPVWSYWGRYCGQFTTHLSRYTTSQTQRKGMH